MCVQTLPRTYVHKTRAHTHANWKNVAMKEVMTAEGTVKKTFYYFIYTFLLFNESYFPGLLFCIYKEEQEKLFHSHNSIVLKCRIIVCV